MKKIKILYGLVIVLILFHLMRYAYMAYTYMLVNIPNDLKAQFIISKIPLLLFIIGLFFVERGLFHSIKKGYFNIKSAGKFKIGGFFFLFYGFTTFILNVSVFFQSYPCETYTFMLYNISESIIVLFIGISLIVISDFLKNGNQLKQENELTI